MKRFASFYSYISQRPLLIAGLALGVAIFASIQGIELGDRVTRVESSSPCKNLTSIQCVRKLVNSLPASERRDVIERLRAEERRLSKLEREAQRLQRDINQTAPRSPDAGNRESAPRSTPIGPGTSAPNTQTPPPAPANPSPPGGSNGSGGGSGGGANPDRCICEVFTDPVQPLLEPVPKPLCNLTQIGAAC